MNNIYAEHEARKATIIAALTEAGATSREHAVTDAQLSPELADIATTVAATGAIRGNGWNGYYLGRTRHNGRS